MLLLHIPNERAELGKRPINRVHVPFVLSPHLGRAIGNFRANFWDGYSRPIGSYVVHSSVPGTSVFMSRSRGPDRPLVTFPPDYIPGSKLGDCYSLSIHHVAHR